MPSASQVLDAAASSGVTHLVGIPDNQTAGLVRLAEADRRFRLVMPCREGEVVSIAAGLWVGHRRPLVFIQNTGLLECGDALRVVLHNMSVPLVMLLGYRGRASMATARPDTAATLLEPTLSAWSVPWEWYRDDALVGAFDRGPLALVYEGKLQ